MKLFDEILARAGFGKEPSANGRAAKISPARTRITAAIKLASTVGFCLFLLMQASVAFGFLILPLLYSFRYVAEIYAGKTWSQASDSERGAPILMAVALLLVLTIAAFLWLAAESEKNPGFHGNIPQQSK